MTRHDILDKDGWHDWRWQDHRTKTIWRLVKDGREVLAPVGVSKWVGKGPTITADRDCKSCHSLTVADNRSTMRSALLKHPLFRSTRPATRPVQPLKPAPVPQIDLEPLLKRIDALEKIVAGIRSGRDGRSGPSGPTGPQGSPGATGAGQKHIAILRYSDGTEKTQEFGGKDDPLIIIDRGIDVEQIKKLLEEERAK